MASVIDELMHVKNWWNYTDERKPKYLEKIPCPSATLSATNSTWTGLGLNPGLRGDRPALTTQAVHGQ